VQPANTLVEKWNGLLSSIELLWKLKENKQPRIDERPPKRLCQLKNEATSAQNNLGVQVEEFLRLLYNAPGNLFIGPSERNCSLGENSDDASDLVNMLEYDLTQEARNLKARVLNIYNRYCK
jgi:hypothetical protein